MTEENKTVKKEKSNGIYDFVSIVATSVIAVAVSFIFLFRTVGVVGSSMYPTLHNGDRIILSAFIDEPEYGDIVVTCQPNSVEDVLVKRIIATEGQTVDFDFENGIVYVDGVALDEPYIKTATNLDEGMEFPLYVEEGYIFVMGDNRNRSRDSRNPRIGLIERREIIGKVVFLVFPGSGEEGSEFDLNRIGVVS